jgi:D-3-phosphoglycerate dehydrogenase / 2-oxoglutarate reductase
LSGLLKIRTIKGNLMAANEPNIVHKKGLIGILDLGYQSYDYEKTFFNQNGYNLLFYDGTADEKSKKDFASSCDGLLVRMTEIDHTFLDGLTKLKAIVRYGIGFDNIDLTACTTNRIAVANVQGYATHSVSDHTIALLFSCLRGIKLASLKIKTDMTNAPFDDMMELHDKTLGIIGLGRIGSRFCEKTKGMFNRVLAYDPYINESTFAKAGAEKSDLETILKNAHVISLHCNLTDETKHILDQNSFAIMKNRPLIINTARGPVIDETALKTALEKDIIHSAGLDVFEDEPLSEKQAFLLEHPRVVTTGHYAWYSEYAAQELQKRAAHNIIDMLSGKKIADQLNII